jgi:hypothetical protein
VEDSNSPIIKFPNAFFDPINDYNNPKYDKSERGHDFDLFVGEFFP